MPFKDDELWQPSGDCLVHLYGQGKSKRGASFRVSYSAVKAASSSLFLEKYLASDVFSSSESSDSTAPSTPVAHADYELYIPVPLDVSREDAYRWHITTRNFFAYIANKPLVGVKLGSAMIDLLERIHSFCPNKAVNIKKFLLYARQQGYSNFVDYPAFALAFLNFAERFRLRELWIDAFAHCVGMNDQLDLNPEFEVSCDQFVSRLRVLMFVLGHHQSHKGVDHSGVSGDGFASGESKQSSSKLPRR